jgi:2,3-bisphosphoglycerate-independent phosphoglycerate mutase
MVQTIPAGMPPGSDVANLSIMGYEPEIYHTGRSPLEAANIGVPMQESDVVFRLNLVTVSDEEIYTDKTMLDHSASDISSEEAAQLIEDLKPLLERKGVKLYTGTSYRNILVWAEGHLDVELTPPHDILEQGVSEYMPKGDNLSWLEDLTIKSHDFLRNHPINLARIERGLNPANSIWVWGEGKKPLLDPFIDKYGVKGATISAVDLIKGIGRCAGMTSLEVEGVTGTIHTNFDGKAKACIEALEEGYDFVYVHLEATDESSHQGHLDEKIKGVEIIDQKIVKAIKESLESKNTPFKMLVLPDHPTPIHLRTHTSNPVPYLLYNSEDSKQGPDSYNEITAEASTCYYKSGPELLSYFLDKRQ